MSDHNHLSDLFKEIWHAARTHRYFNYGYWLERLVHTCFEEISRYTGVFLTACAWIIIVLLSSAAIFFVIPLLFENMEYSIINIIIKVFAIFIGLFSIFNIVFNYTLAIITPPGTPCNDNDNDVEGGNYEICKQCDIPRPPRAHHCRICKSCILQMDHHCPFVNGCVGQGNYRYFLTFIFWVSIGTFYLLLLCVITMTLKTDLLSQTLSRITSFFNNILLLFGFLTNSISSAAASTGKDDDDLDDLIIDMGREGYGIWNMILAILPTSIFQFDQEQRLAFLTLITMSVFLPVFSLGLFHVYLVNSGQTTIEWAQNTVLRSKLLETGKNFYNPYDKGPSENFAFIFGENHSLLSAMLPSFRPAKSVVMPSRLDYDPYAYNE